MKQFSVHVGLDVHKNSIHVAFLSTETGETQSLGGVANDMTRLLTKLEPLGDPSTVQVCYEAGPTGYVLYRKLTALGYECLVVAPAKTPSIASDRVKTDRRDAMKLAQFLASGHLTGIRVPTPEEEALRDLIRARDDVKTKETNTKRQLNSMMLRHDRIFCDGKTLWTKLHLDWLDRQTFDLVGSNEAKQMYIGEVRHFKHLIADLDRQIETISGTLERADFVNALRAFKGIKTLTAASIVTEIGDLKRFSTPGKFASFLGLTPSEHSSGETRKRGRITRAGNGRMRRMLVESAWAYWRSPRVTRELLARSLGVSKEVRDLSWRTQKRLHRRMHALLRRQVSQKKALIAITRELACAIWALGQEENLKASTE